MRKTEVQSTIESYEFHHINISKCAVCQDYPCEEACFRGIYEVINKDSTPKCIVVQDREDMCVKCHICTTACKYQAIKID
jgi:NAD-dependent dihydropyrimidine dehydrogenase PreA subunit